MMASDPWSTNVMAVAVPRYQRDGARDTDGKQVLLLKFPRDPYDREPGVTYAARHTIKRNGGNLTRFDALSTALSRKRPVIRFKQILHERPNGLRRRSSAVPETALALPPVSVGQRQDAGVRKHVQWVGEGKGPQVASFDGSLLLYTSRNAHALQSCYAEERARRVQE